jgi:hypothetical protein
MFNFIDIYIFIPASGCEGRDPSALLCPGAYYAVKKALVVLMGVSTYCTGQTVMVTITQPGNYPKLAVAIFGNINIIDLRSSDSCGANSTPPSAPDVSLTKTFPKPSKVVPIGSTKGCSVEPLYSP